LVFQERLFFVLAKGSAERVYQKLLIKFRVKQFNLLLNTEKNEEKLEIKYAIY
jgi:hypothetical protein